MRQCDEYGESREATLDNITRRMRFARWVTKATDTRLQCVILIAFPQQQWFRESASASHYMWGFFTSAVSPDTD